MQGPAAEGFGVMRSGMRWTLAIVVFVIVCVICGCKVGSSAGSAVVNQADNGAIPDNSITGTVTFNGSPLAGAKVTLFNANSNVVTATTTTDAGGNYSFTGAACNGECAHRVSVVGGEDGLWVLSECGPRARR